MAMFTQECRFLLRRLVQGQFLRPLQLRKNNINVNVKN